MKGAYFKDRKYSYEGKMKEDQVVGRKEGRLR
jgi:hypothetical protein